MGQTPDAPMLPPPHTNRFWPVMKPDDGCRKKATALAASSGVPMRATSRGKLGVIEVVTLNLIRRWALRDHMSSCFSENSFEKLPQGRV